MIASSLPSCRSKCQELLAWNAASCLSVWLRSLRVNPSLDTLLSAVGQSDVGSSHLVFLNSGHIGCRSLVKSSGSWELGRSSDPFLSHSLHPFALCVSLQSFSDKLAGWSVASYQRRPNFRPNTHPSFAFLLPFHRRRHVPSNVEWSVSKQRLASIHFPALSSALSTVRQCLPCTIPPFIYSAEWSVCVCMLFLALVHFALQWRGLKDWD